MITDEQIMDTYPPTGELLRQVGRSTGTASDIANFLLLGPNGPREWRRWVSGEKTIPRFYYRALVRAHYAKG